MLHYFLYFSGINYLYSRFRGQHIIALGYHSITTPESIKNYQGHLYEHLSVSFEMFRKHVKYLKAQGYTFCTFSQLYSTETKKKRALLYFDDGFQDNFLKVYPFLKKQNIPATIFPVVNFLEKKSTYPSINIEPDKLNMFLSWDQLKQMSDIFEIGTHTMSHPKLSKLKPSSVRWELETSKKIIEKKTGKRVTTLSYPKSNFSTTVQDIAKKTGFSFTIANGRGINKKPMFLMKKIPIGPKDGMLGFKVKIGILYPLLSFFNLNK